MKKVLFAVLCAVGLLVGLGTAAWASPAAPQPSGRASAPRSGAQPTTTVSKIKLVRRGFDAKVAVAHGYRVGHDADGNPYSYKPGQPRPLSAGGDYKYGNCGDSFIYFNGVGNSRGEVRTGYSVIDFVDEVHWPVLVHDSAGNGVVPVDRNAEPSNWHITFYTANHKGAAWAQVETGAFVILTNGDVCYSLGPKDYTTIY